MKKVNRRKKVFFRKKNENDVRVHKTMHIYHYYLEITFKHTAIEEKTRKEVIGFSQAGFISATDVHDFRRIVDDQLAEMIKNQYFDSLTKKTPEIDCLMYKSVNVLS